MAEIAPSWTEALLTSRDAFDLPATPLQRAICRVADGASIEHLWDTWALDDYAQIPVSAAFRGVKPPEVSPETMAILAAIRGAKSTMACCAIIRMSQCVDLTGVIPGDEIRIPVLSVDKDSAAATFAKLSGMILARPALRELLVEEPRVDTIRLRHPTGHAIEVKVVALAKYGSTVVSRWLAGIVFDEGPLMAGEDDAVKNLSEARRAVAGRILPGGQEWIIGSPWGAAGPVYDLVQEHQDAPSAEVVVVRSPGSAMNPRWWTRERCEKLARKDPKAHRTNVEAEFADPEETQFASVLVEDRTRKEPGHLPPAEGVHYVATMDPATRGNAWTLVITGNYGFGGPGGFSPKMRVAYFEQWRGSRDRPLKPGWVLEEIAAKCQEYGLTEAYTDQWAVDPLKDLAEQKGLTLHEVTLDGKNRIQMADEVKQMLQNDCLELPRDRQFRQDLVSVKKRVTVNSYTLVLPKTGDGRHCDYAPPILLMSQVPPDFPDEPEPETSDEPDFTPEVEGWADVFGRL